MALRRQRQAGNRFVSTGDPDLTPLINCMFLMLIFFMVATTFVNPKGLSVDLPGGGGDSSRATKDINIVLDRDGAIQVNGETIEKTQLGAKISRAMKDDNAKNVILEAARSISHGKVVEIVDIARGQGIEGIAFAKSAEEG